ncbi:MAG: molybdopterin-dependent oxidoreductase [Chloroflexota bacterium]
MRAFWIGIAAGFAFVVVELLGRVVAGVPTVPELIQDRLVLLLPGQVFSFVLDRLLYLGKPGLFSGLLLVQAVLGGVGGLVFARWREPIALGAVIWLATGLIVLPVAGQGVFANDAGVAFVSLLASGAYVLALRAYRAAPESAPAAVTGASAEPRRAATGMLPAASRRSLLGGSASFLVSAVLGREIIGTLPTLPPRPDEAVAAGSPGPAATPASSATPALPASVTPADRFYVVSKNLIDPVVDAKSWQLSVGGLVTHPFSLSYADILAMPSKETYRTLECISNEVGGDLISNGQWVGVGLADLLTKAEVSNGATTVHFTSVDGYTDTMALEKARDPSTLLAYKLNGQPLPSKHGFPLRVLGTGTYGMKNPKWLTRIDLITAVTPGFWEGQGWSSSAIVQTMARIDAPASGSTVQGPIVPIAGIAFAGARGIQRVEVSTDGGKSWAAVQTQTPLGANTWTLWTYAWQSPKPGNYNVVVRAVDGTGQVQTPRETDTFPDGATGYESIDIRVNA